MCGASAYRFIGTSTHRRNATPRARRHEPAAPSDSDRLCLDGQHTDPYEQNTQQSPGFGRSNAPQALHA
ncbi:hypothetical protein AQ610_25620 [Burkholderia humptydooensis]|uniref:Uncharacterized protein n=1 Tax=Burkholderia humptydooensis MSMB43 TaxID=441157 RepID=A0ABN0G3R3_9BURK|nr:hypothetical protein AQ610_25620 [Burkholderia humptydooensis]EIP86787.1 hypothetical protein A33K_16390 [Burkholderia humptydooensis MSMB43]KST71033.1 hypothetical protein WS76_20745 [Burkholderia humptydooensis]